MYTVAEFGAMAADPARMRAYEEALRRTVKPGCVVVDVGAGTGIFSLWACKLGAARVHAIEPNPAVDVLRENVKRNGFGDRVEIYRALSTDVVLPERCDVLVSDLRGASPLFESHLLAIVDARTRFLADGGILIPQRDELVVGLVECEEAITSALRGSKDETFDLSAQRASILDSELDPPRELGAEALLSEESTWATLDYTKLERPDAAGRVVLTTTRAGTCHGLVLSFRATLVDGVGWFTGLGSPRQVYRRTLLPWREPLPLAAGERVAVDLRAAYSPHGYVWSWSTAVGDPVRHRSRQSNFHVYGLDALGAGTQKHRKVGLRRRGTIE